jgi:chromosome segregation ATPase
MTIPVQHDDDDFYINTTLADAQATIAALQARVNGLEKDSELLRQSRDDFRVKYESVKNDAITLQAQLTQRTAELEAAQHDAEVYRKMHAVASMERNILSNERADLQAELERVRDQFADLRKMVAALPKVEGQWTVSCAMADRVVEGGIVSDISEAVAAIVQHRQGMEGVNES